MTLTRLLADLPDIGINANQWTTGLTSAVGPWIAGALGVAIVILAVLIGWQKFRTLCDPEDESVTYDQWLEDGAEEYEHDLAVDTQVEAYAADLEGGGDAAMDALEEDSGDEADGPGEEE